MMTDPIERDVFDKLKQTPKYGGLCDETLLRMASWAAARHASPREALKAAKRKLHQVYGAYCGQCDLRRVAETVQALPHGARIMDRDTGAPEESIRSACRDLLRHHASTREREAILDQVFPAIFDEIGPVTSILDLACGLGPFMLPWMAPSDAVEYYACDIDTRLVAILNEFLVRLGRPPAVQCRDLLVSVPSRVADVALLLKALPCLEQQEKGAGLRLLPQIPARYIVASFPAQSLGGRAKGMVQHYETYMLSLAAALHFSVRSFPFPSETFYVLARPI